MNQGAGEGHGGLGGFREGVAVGLDRERQAAVPRRVADADGQPDHVRERGVVVPELHVNGQGAQGLGLGQRGRHVHARQIGRAHV